MRELLNKYIKYIKITMITHLSPFFRKNCKIMTSSLIVFAALIHSHLKKELQLDIAIFLSKNRNIFIICAKRKVQILPL